MDLQEDGKDWLARIRQPSPHPLRPQPAMKRLARRPLSSNQQAPLSAPAWHRSPAVVAWLAAEPIHVPRREVSLCPKEGTDQMHAKQAVIVDSTSMGQEALLHGLFSESSVQPTSFVEVGRHIISRLCLHLRAVSGCVLYHAVPWHMPVSDCAMLSCARNTILIIAACFSALHAGAARLGS